MIRFTMLYLYTIGSGFPMIFYLEKGGVYLIN